MEYPVRSPQHLIVCQSCCSSDRCEVRSSHTLATCSHMCIHKYLRPPVPADEGQ